MKKNRVLTLGIASLLIFNVACKKEASQENATQEEGAVEQTEVPAKPVEENKSEEASASWEGLYSGVLPCASCPGIETTIKLNADGTYERVAKYQESDTPTESTKGNFTFSEDKTKISIEKNTYLVEKDQITMLDAEGNVVKGELADKYILKKK